MPDFEYFMQAKSGGGSSVETPFVENDSISLESSEAKVDYMPKMPKI